MIESAEEWRPCARAPDYEVSSLGRVRSITRTVQTRSGPRLYQGKVMSPSSSNQYGHLKVNLTVDGCMAMTYVHQLVADAYLGPKPAGHEAAHRNGDPGINHASNMKWATPTENQADRRDHGTHLEGERHPGAKLTAEKVQEIRRRARREVHAVVAKDYGVTQQTVSDIVTGRRWSSVAQPET